MRCSHTGDLAVHTSPPITVLSHMTAGRPVGLPPPPPPVATPVVTPAAADATVITDTVDKPQVSVRCTLEHEHTDECDVAGTEKRAPHVGPVKATVAIPRDAPTTTPGIVTVPKYRSSFALEPSSTLALCACPKCSVLYGAEDWVPVRLGYGHKLVPTGYAEIHSYSTASR